MKSNYVLAALVLALAGAAPSGSINAANDTIYRYTTPQTGYYTIDYMALSDLTTLTPSDFEKNVINGGMRLTGCMGAGINLPQGAKIKVLRIWHDDGTTNATVKMQRRALNNGNVSDIVSAFPLASPPNARTKQDFPVAAQGTVDNELFSYSFHICLSNRNFWSARIEYTYNNAGD